MARTPTIRLPAAAVHRLKGMSIRGKLKAILMATSVTAVAIACAAFLAYDFISTRDAIAERLETLAQVVGGQSTAALAFDDARSASEILGALAAEKNIAGARLDDRQGKPFARYDRPGPRKEALKVSRPIMVEGERIGTVHLAGDLGEADAHLRHDAIVMGLVLLACVGVAWFLSSHLERLITKPLLGLAGTVHSVSTLRDYSVRAAPGNRDELGTLIDGFNDMLSQIQSRDEAIQKARGELERRVKERTLDLTRANVELWTRARQQAAATALGQRALSDPDPISLMNQASSVAASTLGADFAGVLELLPDGDTFLLRAGTGWKKGLVGSARIAAGESTPARRALRTSEPVIVHDLDRESRPEDTVLLRGHGAASGISVVVPGQSRPYGVLGVYTARPRDFTKDDANFLRAIANVLAAALERARAERSLREGEERYRRLFESSPDGIVIESEGNPVFMNPAAERILGVTEPAELAGAPLLARARSEPRAEETGTAFFEDQWVRSDGRRVDVEVASIPFAHQGAEGSQVMIRDITRRKELDRMKDEFVSTVSHELRTPLTSIRGSLGLIAGGAAGEIPPLARSLVDVAHGNCKRLVRLINDILDIEKIAAGKMKYDFRPADLSRLVGQSLEANREYAEARRVRFVLDLRAPGARVLADADRLMQVLANLLSNAAKYSPEGGEVRVSVEPRGTGFRVGVSDRGPGIPPEFRGRIFQRFAQADSSDRREKGGSGLGLAITRAIVEKHGGRIDFETGPAGTTFRFDLPGLKEEAPAAPDRAGAPRVLVCEDDREASAAAAETLRRGGFSVDPAYSADEARRRLVESDYDAMVLDVLLPDQDGVWFLRELRRQERTRGLPVVVVSAVAESARRELESEGPEPVDCLQKPVDPARLLAAVRLAAGRRGAAAVPARS